MTLTLEHPPMEAGEILCVMCEACIHASEGARVSHDHFRVIEFVFDSECIFWVLHQRVSPGGGGLGTETLLGISWGQW
jgi:hypothetical protein